MALTNPTRDKERHTKLLDTTELARRWGMSPRTLQRWRAERYGPPFLSLGGAVRYRLEDIEAYEARHLQPCGLGGRSPLAQDPADGSSGRRP